MPTYDVSCIGFYVLDILGRAIESIPPGGRAHFIDEITLTTAGTAGATAVACGIHGLKTLAVTTVGDDDKGAFLIDDMTRHGVDVSLVKKHPDVPTSATILPVRPDGERPAWHVPGTAAVFEVAAEDEDRALDADIVHIGGTGLLKAFDGAPTLHLYRRAKSLGRTTVFDLIQATPETWKLVEPLLPHIDYFLPSIEEAREMAGRDNPDDVAKFFLDRGTRVCGLTMGGEGSLIVTRDSERIRMPAFDIPISDTTGCGDSYTAGFIVGLHKGWSLEETTRFATAVSAIVATGLGSNARLKGLEQTLSAMRTMKAKALD